MRRMVRSVNPHRPSEVVIEIEGASVRDVDRSVKEAGDALPGWRATPAGERGAALTRVAEDLASAAEELTSLVVREVGKPVTEARAEVARGIAICRYYGQLVLMPEGDVLPSGDGASLLMTRRHPVGVCALVTPWNFPIAIPMWKAAPALAYGNAVRLKPASAATAVAGLLAEILSRHVPEGIFDLVVGDGATGRALVEHPGVSAISFTGSEEVGRAVARAAVERNARFQCELGGQNPSVILPDADLMSAARIVGYAAMGYAGQKCTATSRVIAHADVYEDVRDRLVAEIEALDVVDPSLEACRVGPMIDERARHESLQAIRGSGGRVLTGGEALDAEGYYLAPTLVEVEEPQDPLAQEEVFAPVVALLRGRSEDELIDLANGVRQGLVAAVFTSRIDRALSLLDRLEAGLVRVNAPTSGVDFHAPFGGTKGSGIGPKEQGLAARDFFTESRTILITP